MNPSASEKRMGDRYFFWRNYYYAEDTFTKTTLRVHVTTRLTLSLV